MTDKSKHFKIRLTPELHRLVRLAAAEEAKTMQAFLEELIGKAINLINS